MILKLYNEDPETQMGSWNFKDDLETLMMILKLYNEDPETQMGSWNFKDDLETL